MNCRKTANSYITFDKWILWGCKKIHYKDGENFEEAVRTAFGHHQAPARPAIVKLIDKFESLEDKLVMWCGCYS